MAAGASELGCPAFSMSTTSAFSFINWETEETLLRERHVLASAAQPASTGPTLTCGMAPSTCVYPGVW